MLVEQWLGKDNTLGIDIWNRKYRKGEETFDQWLDRVSNNNSDVRQAILDKKFIPGGRILSNRGIKNTRVTYSNCYVVTPPEDSLESIYESRTKLARTYSYGGGCGIDISNLAPAGARVHNQAEKTSGAVSFMDGYSMTTEEIGQNGRRGALMISLDCHHPDLMDFIDIKTKEGKVTKANISVRVTDDFMRAVENDEDWVMSFTRKETGDTITKVEKARVIFDKLCENNWNWAEPGILFWDNICNYNLLSNNKDFKYAGTNPCVTGDTLVSTTRGEIPIRELVGQTPDVYCMDEQGHLTIKRAEKVWKTRENAQVLRIKTRRGNLRCTPNHLIFTRNRGWVEAQDLRKGDKLTGLNKMMGDETHVCISLTGEQRYVAEHRFVAGNYFDIKGKDVHHIDGDMLNNSIDNLQVLSHAEHSRITNTGRKIETLHDNLGRFMCKPVKAVKRSFNLGNGTGTNWFVQEVEWLSELEDVYDMTVPETHNFIANRIVVHNCAEEPLPAGGSCLLSSINLSAFVNEDGKFDFDDFYRVVDIGVNYLNEVLEEGLMLHPLQEQRDSVAKWRQIGLGVMGVADMLIKMHLRYDSDEAIEHCRDVSMGMANHAMYVSARIASHEGMYPGCTANIESTPFFKANADTLTRNVVERYGMANSQLLTIAPTGTISTMLGVSGGIEPIFAKSYRRKTESLHGGTQYYDVLTPIYKDYAEKHGLTVNDKFPEWFVDSSEINYNKRIEMQSAWQKGIDASISSTVNLPNSATIEDVKNIYLNAWRCGLKGITVYRAGCKREGVLVSEEATTENKTLLKDEDLPRGFIVDCTEELVGKKRKLITGCGSLHVLAYFNPINGSLQEVYFNKGSTGGCANFMTGLSRMVSLLCRAGVDIISIKDQLDSTGVCPSYATRTATKHDTSRGSCCPMAIGNALLDMWNEMQSEVTDVTDYMSDEHPYNDNGSVLPKPVYSKCPECGEPLAREGGCVQCKSCGWSKCE